MQSKVAVTAIALTLMLFTSALAVEIPTPAGYTPWFSYDVQEGDPDELLIAASNLDIVGDYKLIVAKVTASNPENVGTESDPSTQTMVVPKTFYDANWNPATDTWTKKPLLWSGDVIPRETDGGPFRVGFTKATGTVTRYTIFVKVSAFYGACGKPSTPTFSMAE